MKTQKLERSINLKYQSSKLDELLSSYPSIMQLQYSDCVRKVQQHLNVQWFLNTRWNRYEDTEIPFKRKEGIRVNRIGRCLRGLLSPRVCERLLREWNGGLRCILFPWRSRARGTAAAALHVYRWRCTWREWVEPRMRSCRGKVNLGGLTEVVAVHIPILTTSLRSSSRSAGSLIARKLRVAPDPLSRYF